VFASITFAARQIATGMFGALPRCDDQTAR
jgi:hypothetical protein